MVLGNRMTTPRNRNLTSLFLLYASAVVAEPTDHLNFLGHLLDLSFNNGKCVVIDLRTNGVLDTELTPPCLFMRRTKDTVLSFHYPNIGTVFVISGAPADQEYISKWPTVSLEDQCSSEAQGLIITRTRLNLTRKKNKFGLFCPRIGSDEKVFYGFAHQE